MKTPNELSYGLRLSIYTGQDVQDWVDDAIRDSEIPSNELIDLGWIAKTDIQGMISILEKLPDDTEIYAVLRKLFSKLDPVKLESLEFCRTLAESLYCVLRESNYAAPEEFNEVLFFDDEYELAANGTYGTLDEWHANFKNYIVAFRGTC